MAVLTLARPGWIRCVCTQITNAVPNLFCLKRSAVCAGRGSGWDLDAGRARLALEGGISTIRMLLCTQLYCDSALGRPAPRFDARAIGECHAMLDARSQGRRRRVCVPVLFKDLKSINTQYQRFAAGVQGCIWMYRCYGCAVILK